MTYDESLITSEVCVRCASCCKLTIGRPDPRPDKMIEWENVIARQTDNIEILPDARVRFHCPELVIDGEFKKCGIYKDRPRICSQYNCFEMANKMGRPPENYEMIMGIINKLKEKENHFSDPSR